MERDDQARRGMCTRELRLRDRVNKEGGEAPPPCSSSATRSRIEVRIDSTFSGDRSTMLMVRQSAFTCHVTLISEHVGESALRVEVGGSWSVYLVLSKPPSRVVLEPGGCHARIRALSVSPLPIAQ